MIRRILWTERSPAGSPVARSILWKKIVEVEASRVRFPMKISHPSLNKTIPWKQGFFMFTTYILKSKKDQGYYFGHCSDIQTRLLQHNKGQVRSTKSRAPFVIHYTEPFETKSEAYRREMYFKSLEGRHWLISNHII
jgi:putative endonuclease